MTTPQRTLLHAIVTAELSGQRLPTPTSGQRHRLIVVLLRDGLVRQRDDGFYEATSRGVCEVLRGVAGPYHALQRAKMEQERAELERLVG